VPLCLRGSASLSARKKIYPVIPGSQPVKTRADGTFAAHVDLGSLGVADRWADLAVAAWSTEWNYGPGYDRVLYDAYGIAPDPERIAYYRLLWYLG